MYAGVGAAPTAVQSARIFPTSFGGVARGAILILMPSNSRIFIAAIKEHHQSHQSHLDMPYSVNVRLPVLS